MATFFETADDFRLWLEEHAASDSGLVVGFYKKGSGRPSLSWPEAVDEALWWVVSAKQAATRKTRLARLIELSQNGQRL